ncbi:MAG: hypothetical protein Q8L81_12240 [Bacteroidota bacterium]|nr:hypothetical protein [Bacteroidota bacterium]
MGILNRIFGRKNFDERLFGIWISDTNDEITKKAIGDTSMTFTEDGKLIYDVLESEKIQRINMIYWTEGDIIFTDQPSNPREEKTQYSFPNKDNLLLSFGGQLTRFNKKKI